MSRSLRIALLISLSAHIFLYMLISLETKTLVKNNYTISVEILSPPLQRSLKPEEKKSRIKKNKRKESPKKNVSLQPKDQLTTESESTSNKNSASISSPTKAASLSSQISPNYPEDAKSDEVEGVVIVLADISDHGRVTSAKIISSSGHKGLDYEALQSVLRAGFHPALDKGVKVPSSTKVRVNFSLEN